MEAKPNIDQAKALKKNPNEGPVFILNLMKFVAEGGRASFARYGMEMEKYMQEVGGQTIFIGKPQELLIGHETWDAVVLVRYPSRQTYMKMVNNPDFQAIHHYRTEAIERSVIYAVDEVAPKELLFGGK